MRYLLFVSFFPHLIAGPVLHHAQMMPQLEKPEPTWTGFSNGLFLFAIGLAKKFVVADSLGTLVDASAAGLEAGPPSDAAGTDAHQAADVPVTSDAPADGPGSSGGPEAGVA